MSRQIRPDNRIVIPDISFHLFFTLLQPAQFLDLPRSEKPHAERCSDIHEPGKQLCMQIDIAAILPHFEADGLGECTGYYEH